MTPAFVVRCWFVLASMAFALVAGCASVETPAERRATADTLANAAGWQRSVVASAPMALVAYGPAALASGTTLFVYLEGDGFAWLSPSTPSADPTPRDALGLKLALRQTDGNAVYLARPCQYVASSGCAERYWTQARFAPEVIESSNAAISLLKARYGATALVLVGYSGGGAVAALVAARRDDVMGLVTVAGNLDTAAWTRLHGVSALTGSLNPADFTSALAQLAQWHFAGSDDRVVPPVIARGFVARLPPASAAQVVVEPGFDHHCCWEAAWPRLLSRLPVLARE